MNTFVLSDGQSRIDRSWVRAGRLAMLVAARFSFHRANRLPSSKYGSRSTIADRYDGFPVLPAGRVAFALS